MQDLEHMVAALPDSQEKDLFLFHLARGLHPAEDLFARYALFALSGEFSSDIRERGEAAYFVLRESLASLPPSPSSYALMRELNRDSFANPEQSVMEQIEMMLRLANVATLLQVSYEDPEVQEVEKVIQEEWPGLVSRSTVAGQKSAQPVVLRHGLFLLYSGKKDLRGICLKCLPGEKEGLPIIFASSDYFPGGQLDTRAIVHVVNHEMIHSAQKIEVGEEIAGWDLEAQKVLLEALTEGLNVCRLKDREPFSPDQISQRDYAYAVLALFQAMRDRGIADGDFSKKLEELNSGSLAESVAFVGSSQEFLMSVERAKEALLLQHIEGLQLKRGEAGKMPVTAAGQSLQMIDELIFPEGRGLEIIDEVLAAEEI